MVTAGDTNVYYKEKQQAPAGLASVDPLVGVGENPVSRGRAEELRTVVASALEARTKPELHVGKNARVEARQREKKKNLISLPAASGRIRIFYDSRSGRSNKAF